MAKTEAQIRAQARYREKNREALAEAARVRRAQLKLEALETYGPECAWCGYNNPLALCIDHIENNGAEERKSLGGQKFSGWKFYFHLKKLGWPEGYQTLCANCNMIKHVEFREENMPR